MGAAGLGFVFCFGLRLLVLNLLVGLTPYSKYPVFSGYHVGPLLKQEVSTMENQTFPNIPRKKKKQLVFGVAGMISSTSVRRFGFLIRTHAKGQRLPLWLELPPKGRGFRAWLLNRLKWVFSWFLVFGFCKETKRFGGSEGEC